MLGTACGHCERCEAERARMKQPALPALAPRIYIAGPMTGHPESNYPAFNAAAAAWREKGWEVENPAEHFGGAQDRTYEEYVEVDIAALTHCDAIALLPGWNGPGARGSVWERAIARHLLHIPVFDATSPCKPDVLDHIDGGAQICPVSYDEYREFKRWKQHREAAPKKLPPGGQVVNYQIQNFIDEVIPVNALVEDTPPLSRHPVTGALGRWVR